MKLKYYLRGAGLGIVFATLIMILACSIHKNDLSREEIIKEATKLGMVMPESEAESQKVQTESGRDDSEKENESQNVDSETPATEENDNTDDSEEAQQPAEPEVPSETPPASEAPTTVSFSIHSGWVSRDVANALYANGLIADAEAFQKVLAETGVGYQLEVGVYTFPIGATEQQILDILRAGDGMD